MKILTVLLLLLASCAYSPRVSEVGLYPYYGAGLSTRVGSSNSARTESYGLMVGFVFKLQDKNEKEGWKSMANMDRRAQQREKNELAAAKARQDVIDKIEKKRIFDEAVAAKLESDRIDDLEREHAKEQKEDSFPLKEILASVGAIILAITGIVIKKLTGKPKEQDD